MRALCPLHFIFELFVEQSRALFIGFHDNSIYYMFSVFTKINRDTEIDLQNPPCHLRDPEVQADLGLPSLRTHRGVRSDQLNLDDPGERREKHKMWDKKQQRNKKQTPRQYFPIIHLTESNFQIHGNVIFAHLSPVESKSHLTSVKQKMLIHLRLWAQRHTTSHTVLFLPINN